MSKGRAIDDGVFVRFGNIHRHRPKLFELGDGEIIVGAVFQFDIEFKIVLQSGLGKVARPRDHAAFIHEPLVEGHDIDLRMEFLAWVGLDLQLAGTNPLYKLVDARFHHCAVGGMFEFGQHIVRDFPDDRGVGLQRQFALFSGLLQKLICRAVGM